MLAYLLKKFSDFCCFFQNCDFVEYFFKMPPKKRSKRKDSQERERMFTQVQARSPELEELTCVPETQQSQQAAGLEVRVEDPLEIQKRVTLHLRHSRIGIQVMSTLLTHRKHRLLGGHRRARVKANQQQGRGNMYRKRRLTKEPRKPLLISMLRRSRNWWSFCMTNSLRQTLKDYKDWSNCKEGGCVGSVL